MEFVRKRRIIKYGEIKCKEYLRIDFHYCCAYCGFSEKSTGAIGHNYFEIDHFRPVAKFEEDDTFDVNEYENLFYSCQNCNREKSDDWSEDLLNPCEDYIHSPNGIIELGSDSIFRTDSLIGQNYINTFKLNASQRIRMRKEVEEGSLAFKEKASISREILKLIERNLKNNNVKESVKGKFVEYFDKCIREDNSELRKTEIFELLEEAFLSRDIKYNLNFYENNLDCQIRLGDKEYLTEVVIDQKNELKKYKLFDTKKFQLWDEKTEDKTGIIVFFSKLNKMYFYKRSEYAECMDSVRLVIDDSYLI